MPDVLLPPVTPAEKASWPEALSEGSNCILAKVPPTGLASPDAATLMVTNPAEEGEARKAPLLYPPKLLATQATCPTRFTDSQHMHDPPAAAASLATPPH